MRAFDRRSTLSNNSCSRRRSALSRFCCSISCLCASAALSSFRSASRILSLHRRLLLNFNAVRPRSSFACRSAFAPTKSCSMLSAKKWEVHSLMKSRYQPVQGTNPILAVLFGMDGVGRCTVIFSMRAIMSFEGGWFIKIHPLVYTKYI